MEKDLPLELYVVRNALYRGLVYEDRVFQAVMDVHTPTSAARTQRVIRFLGLDRLVINNSYDETSYIKGVANG